MDSKRYGLILSQKAQSVLQKKPSVFEDSSDEENSPAGKAQPQKEVEHLLCKKQLQVTIQTALEEDPTVFEYDSIYDSMQQGHKTQKIQHKPEDKKPRYIAALIQTAEKRKRENERRIERKVQREREEEGDEFRNKESFVTSSYRKKILELQEEEERERSEQCLEKMMDVTKQKDLSGFYRHLLNQKVGEENVPTRNITPNSALPQNVQMTNENSSRIDKNSGVQLSESFPKDTKNTESFSKHLSKNVILDSDLNVNSRSSSDTDWEVQLNSSVESVTEFHYFPKQKFLGDTETNLTNSEKTDVTELTASERTPFLMTVLPKRKSKEASNFSHDSCKTDNRRNVKTTVRDGGDNCDAKSTITAAPGINPISKYAKRNIGELFCMARQRYLARKEAQ